jgi:hypothetical protein
MCRSKIVCLVTSLTSAAAVLLGGGAATAAAAGSWYVGGTKLATTAAAASTAGVDEATSFVLPSERVTCNGGGGKLVRYAGPKLKAADLWEAESVVFLGCSEVEPAGCSVENTIATEPLVALLETTTSPLDRIRFKASKGNILATVVFEGASCDIAGEKPVDGQVVARLKQGQTENIIQLLEPLGSVENNSFELGGQKVFAEKGGALLKLAAGSKWSFH